MIRRILVTLAIVVVGCAAFQSPNDPARAVLDGAQAHGAVCDAYKLACQANDDACDSRADAACAVRCAP